MQNILVTGGIYLQPENSFPIQPCMCYAEPEPLANIKNSVFIRYFIVMLKRSFTRLNFDMKEILVDVCVKYFIVSVLFIFSPNVKLYLSCYVTIVLLFTHLV